VPARRATSPRVSSETQTLDAAFFARPVTEVAERLIGCGLTFAGVGGRIVEAEAYHRTDPASHSFRGETRRNATMFGPVGHAYVYRSYGVHWCLNFVAGEEPGSAVLIRALEPVFGVEAMMARRGLGNARLLCSGPGRLTQAMGITGEHNGLRLDRLPFLLTPPDDGGVAVLAGRRIGLTRAVEVPWRFGLAGSHYLSRPFRKEERTRSS
jgi:DNA-3-methyladenine glycosylase